ncbi:MAG: CheR family methyltransferase [Longimicrobiales bacterium]
MPPDERRLPSPLHLAQGELAPADLAELLALKAQIQARRGFACENYKEKCLRRRVAVRMRARGVHRFADYAALLENDPTEYDRLLAVITINVSKFFRNAEVWSTLSERVLPQLLAPGRGTVRAWSAGCAAGEEPYTLAIALLEFARARRDPRSARRFEIIGTDVDDAILDAARRAEYGESALSETSPELRQRWFEPGPPFRPKASVRSLVRFRRLDLLREPFPQPLHLVFCRNVFIYFERNVQESLFERFHAALEPGGFLVLGKVETIFGPGSRLFEPVSSRDRIYRRA